MKKITLAVLLALGTFAASAAEPGAYFGASLGYVHGRADSSDFGFESKDHSGIPYKFFAGYQFSRYLAAEAGFHDLGSYNYAGTAWHDDYELKAVAVSAVGTLPIDDKFSVSGKLGVSYNWSSDHQAYSGTASTQPSFGTGESVRYSPYIGVGGAYALTKNVDLRVEYENFGKFGKAWSYGEDSGRMNYVYTVTAGVAYRF